MIEISVTCHADGSETASATFDGAAYSAKSSGSSVHALCRVLVAAGCPDVGWSIPGRQTGRVWASAVRTVSDAGGPPRLMPWVPHPRADVHPLMVQLVTADVARRAADRDARRG